MSATEPAAQPGAGWDEAQCKAALAQLEQLQTQVRRLHLSIFTLGLHAQIDDLRLAIPRITEPFHRPPNPSTFKLYSQGVVGSQNGINALSDKWRSPEVQDILAHARKSYEANSDLSTCTSVPAHGWVERENRERESLKGNREHVTVEDQIDSLDEERISQIIAEVQEAHPNIKLELQDDGHSIRVGVLSNLSVGVLTRRADTVHR